MKTRRQGQQDWIKSMLKEVRQQPRKEPESKSTFKGQAERKEVSERGKRRKAEENQKKLLSEKAKRKEKSRNKGMVESGKCFWGWARPQVKWVRGWGRGSWKRRSTCQGVESWLENEVGTFREPCHWTEGESQSCGGKECRSFSSSLWLEGRVLVRIVSNNSKLHMEKQLHDGSVPVWSADPQCLSEQMTLLIVCLHSHFT